jgi:hypothetical protein
MFLEAIGRIADRMQAQPINIAPPAITVNPPSVTVEATRVEVAAPHITLPEQAAPVVNVTVEPPKPKHVVIERDARGLAKTMREVNINESSDSDPGSDQDPHR